MLDSFRFLNTEEHGRETRSRQRLTNNGANRCAGAGEVEGGAGAVLGFGPGLGLGFAFGVEFGDEGEECAGLGGEVGGVLVEGVEDGGHAFGVGDEFGEEGEDGLGGTGERVGDGGGGHGWMMSDGWAASRSDSGGPQVCARGATMGGERLSGGIRGRVARMGSCVGVGSARRARERRVGERGDGRICRNAAAGG